MQTTASHHFGALNGFMCLSQGIKNRQTFNGTQTPSSRGQAFHLRRGRAVLLTVLPGQRPLSRWSWGPGQIRRADGWRETCKPAMPLLDALAWVTSPACTAF